MFKKTLVLATLLALSLAALITLPSRDAAAAPPADDVYDIAVLDVGDSFDWTDDDFQALTANEHDWEMIQPSDLTASNLDDFDVLIIPWDHNYGWLTPQIAAAIMDFVDGGGTLIIHATDECEEVCEIALPDGFEDELLSFFPSEYLIQWFDDNGDASDENVLIINPSHALATLPNVVTEPGLSGWSSSIHSFIGDWGSAWQWVLATDFTDPPGEEVSEGVLRAGQGDELSVQAIEPGVDVAMVQGCAPFGDGVIVVSGQDPEYHGAEDQEMETYLQIENEIKLGAVGCGNRPSRDREERQRPPSIGAGLSGLFNGMPTPLPTAPSAVAPAATSPVITPPRTGDAGLADETVPAGLAVAVGLFVATTLISLRMARR